MQNQKLVIIIPENWSSRTGPYPNRISAIKAIRAITGCGLKESKDITDEQGEYILPIWHRLIEASSGDENKLEKYLKGQFRILQECGVVVRNLEKDIISDLKAVIARAEREGHHEMASEIGQFILSEVMRKPYLS